MAFQSDILSEWWVVSVDNTSMLIPTTMKGWVVHLLSRSVLNHGRRLHSIMSRRRCWQWKDLALGIVWRCELCTSYPVSSSDPKRLEKMYNMWKVSSGDVLLSSDLYFCTKFPWRRFAFHKNLDDVSWLLESPEGFR